MDEFLKKRRRIQLPLMVIGMAILINAVAGVTYAFFNYTRTGNTNTVKTGRIDFNTTEGSAINLTNAFPITSTQAQTDTTNAKTLSITVTGDTDYSGGLEYLVTLSDVHMTVGASERKMPVAIEVSVGYNGEGENITSLGEEDINYYDNRSDYATHHYNRYKVEYDGNLDEGSRILVGYIAPNTTPGTASGINGIINIMAYLDSSKILVSNTYNNGNNPTDEKGTPVDLGSGKTVFTTSEWNSIMESGNELSFKVKIESSNGIWVPSLSPALLDLALTSGVLDIGSTSDIMIIKKSDGALSCQSSDESIASCSIFNRSLNITGIAAGNAVITVTQEAAGLYALPGTISYEVEVMGSASCPGDECVYTKSYNELNNTINGTLGVDYKTSYNDYGNYFLGHILDSQGKIRKSYACGINTENNNAVFCLRGGVDEYFSYYNASVFNDNAERLAAAFPECDVSDYRQNSCYNNSGFGATINVSGAVSVSGTGYCMIGSNGSSSCFH